jgi:hypothetical protein
MQKLLEIGSDRSRQGDVGVMYSPGITSESGSPFLLKGEDFVLDAASALALLIRNSGVAGVGRLVKFVKNEPLAAVQALVTEGRLVLMVRVGGEVSIYSGAMRDRWPRPLTAYAQNKLQIFDDTEVAWYSKLDGDPVVTTAGVVMKGKKPVVDKPARSKSRLPHGGWTPESIVDAMLQ